MKKRFVVTFGVAAVFLVLIGGVKVRQIQAAIRAGAAFKPAPDAVTTIVAKAESWPVTLSAIGTVVAVQGVLVSADLPGIVESINFRSGQSVQAGDLLVRLDTRQEQAQLLAAEAQHQLAHANLARAQGLGADGVVSQADFDQASAEDKQAEGRLAEVRATIARKEIRAPFAGTLGIRQANLGQYLKAGDPVVELQALQPIHVDFSVPQQELGRLKVGHAVRVFVSATPDAATPAGADSLAGTVTAIDSVVNEATRNIAAQATLPNPGGRLRPGMFVRTEILVGRNEDVLAVPASAINYAPYGNSVFVVTNLKSPQGETYEGVEQHFVKLGAARGDQVAVTGGIAAGQVVVTSGVFKLRNGGAVKVNNSVQPADDLTPRPADS